MSEWIWMLIGMFWGVWVNYFDAYYYKNITRLQQRYIDLLHKRLDDEND